MKNTILLAILFGVLFASCKKDKPSSEIIVGQWTLVDHVYNDYYSNTAHITTTTGGASNTIFFDENGIANDALLGSTRQVSYSVQGNYILTLGLDSYEIRTITNNVLLLYRKEPGVGNIYEEYTISLKR
ncbi:MAG: hypothetical protein ABL929_01115 [Ferruginibacter sp.]|nr:hypothetical protein [Ferruginibacter sp.]